MLHTHPNDGLHALKPDATAQGQGCQKGCDSPSMYVKAHDGRVAALFAR